jgi:hypothetical protein
MAKTLGLHERVGQALRSAGYWPDGRERPDYARFGIEHGFHPNAIYRWWQGETPRGVSLLKFAAALKVSPDWLLGVTRSRTGGRRTFAGLLAAFTIGMVPASGGTLDTVPQVPETLPLIGRRRWWLRPLSLQPLAT